jgi:signal transduction histidine kinase
MKRVLLFYILFLRILVCSAHPQSSPMLRQISGKVTYESGKPVPKAEVSIDGSKYIVADLEGKFRFTPRKELVMPFDVKANKKGYKVLKFFYEDASSEIEVVLAKIKEEKPDKELVVRISDTLGKTIPFAKIKIDGKPYTADKNGDILFQGTLKETNQLQLEGYQFIRMTSEDNIAVVSFVKTENAPVPELPITPEELNMGVFQEYKAYFNKLARELLEEKLRIESLNQKIEEELYEITLKLKNEKNLSPEQRQELHQHARHLENSMKENKTAYQKSASRTLRIIQTLKQVILEKDSIEVTAQQMIDKAQQKNEKTQQKSERNLLIFSVITGLFLVFGIIFYLTFLKIRKQTKKLRTANVEINSIKNELARNVQELKESNEQLEVFVYKASHDIKGPLRSIIGLTTIGQEDVKDPTALNYFKHILQSTQKLDKLLLDLLQLTKVKQATIHPENINFSDIVKDSLSSFTHLPGYEEMKVNIEINENGKFRSDKKLLYSIVQNLIENPIKYKDPSKAESYLNIKIHADEKGASLEFSDNGLGIPADLQTKVFEMFFKIDEKSNGTGLGLYIVKTSVEKLKGKIQLQSAEEKGSTFLVVF